MMTRPSISDLWPRRAQGLPPGQGQVRFMPRFSDDPLRRPPRSKPLALTISIDGVIQQTLGADDLAAFTAVEQTSDFHCVTTWTYRGLLWGGVRVRAVINDVVGDQPPKYLTARGADKTSAVFVTEDLLGDDVLLATHLDGAPLDVRHGAPLRLVSPGQYGYKNVKHLVELDFSHQEPPTTYGNKEHLRGRVDHEERHRTLPNWLLRIPYRLAIIPTARAAERSLRKSIH